MLLKMLYNIKKVHVLSEISPENSLDPDPGSENGEKQLKCGSVTYLTTDFEFCKTPVKSLIRGEGMSVHSFKAGSTKLLPDE